MDRLSSEHFDHWLDLEQRLKGVDVELTRRLEASLRTSLSTLYQAVAADIDGTLTTPDSTVPPRYLIDELRTLLLRGIRIILITGRGHSAEAVLRRIIESLGEERFSTRYLGRIHCLIDNGATLLEWSGEIPIQFSPRTLVSMDDAEWILAKTHENLPQTSKDTLLRVRVRPQRIRFEFSEQEARDLARDSIVDSLALLNPSPFPNVTSAVYRSDTFTIDLTPTTKGQALQLLCRSLGIELERCLRLGDQAGDRGNDFDLLSSTGSFSVDEYSSSPDGSHIVMNSQRKVLKNTEATLYLLKNLSFSAPLASPPIDDKILKRNLAIFERDVRREAEKHLQETFQQFSRSAGRLFSPEYEVSISPDFVYHCYDRHSGAVRVENWELLTPAAHDPLGRLFSLEEFDFSSNRPASDWAMYTDSSVILRGPKYYLEWTHDWDPREIPLQAILEIQESFVGDALTGLAVQADLPANILRLKLLLGVADNIRDILLKLVHFAFSLYSEIDSGPDISVIDEFASLLARHTNFLVALHTDNEWDWLATHEIYFELVGEVYSALGLLRQRVREAELAVFDSGRLGQRLFRSRECDWFLENVAACRIGLEKHVQQQPRLRDRSFGVVGLVYGGLELPFVCQSVGQRIGLDVIPGLISSSSYTRRAVSTDPSRFGLLEVGLNEWISDRSALGDGSSRAKVLLSDDNMTTARSLQKAWDVLQGLGFDVLGAIVVRYPGMNRFVQMSEIDNSVPDPELFMSFVRGLVSPAPYARRVTPSPDNANAYLDFTGLFNKMDDRIKRYLSKALDRNFS